MNTIDLRSHIAVITGAARGIGRGIAERLLASGAAVSVWDIDAEALRTATQQLEKNGDVRPVVVDITNAAAVETATQTTVAHFGHIDILVNNAGISGPNAPVWYYPIDAWRQVIEVNLIGVFHCCRAVVPLMLQHGYGRIVNIASIAGKEGNPQASAYSASKAAVIGFTKSLAKELTPQNILVNCITPAAVETDLFAQMTPEHIQYMLSKIPMGRFGSIAEVAAMVAWLVSAECSFTTGGVFDVSGGRATY